MPSIRVQSRRARWTEEGLRAAMAAVEQGLMTTRAAAEAHDIPRRTLAYHLKTGSNVKRLGRGSVMNEGQENKLVHRLLELLKSGVPLTTDLICREAFIFCEEFNIKHNFNMDLGHAGKDWLKGFLKRHPEWNYLLEHLEF